MDKIEEKIMSILDDDEERSGYAIAKEVGVSWQVVKIRLLELKIKKKVTMRELDSVRPCFLWKKKAPLQPPKKKETVANHEA